MKNNHRAISFGIIIGIAISLGVYGFSHFNESESKKKTQESKPLYWVAPMDADFQRDKPGKSPMGMDLVPVYKSKNKAMNESPGTVYISPSVINNLGVRTTNVSYQILKTHINTVGYVTYNEDTLLHVHPRVEGWVEKLHVKATGNVIKKGQPLYELYSPELVNAQEEFLLALARKNLLLISAAKHRLISLQFSKKTIALLEKNKKLSQRVTFYAAQNGVVTRMNVRQGIYAKPNTMLMEVADLSNVWIEAEVFERQAEHVSLGMSVTVTLDSLPGKYWQGKVDYIYPVLTAATRTVKLRLRFNNENKLLKPNMFAKVTIHSTNKEKTITIPQESLIRTGLHDRVVLSLGEGKFKSIIVDVGRYGDKNVEILSGLNIGEKIVSSAQFLLDSESSKTSDFKRIDQPSNQKTVSSIGIVNSINNTIKNKRIINIRYNLIEQSNMAVNKPTNTPVKTQNFMLTHNVDIQNVHVGMLVDFTFEHNDGVDLITRISERMKASMGNFSEGVTKTNGQSL